MRAFGQQSHLAGRRVPGHVAVAGQAGHGAAHVRLRGGQVGGEVAHGYLFRVVVGLAVAHQHLQRVQPVDALELLVAGVGEKLLALKVGRLLVFGRYHREVDGGLAQVPGQGLGPNLHLVVRVAVGRVLVHAFLAGQLQLLLAFQVLQLGAGVRHRVLGALVDGDRRAAGRNHGVAEHVGPRRGLELGLAVEAHQQVRERAVERRAQNAPPGHREAPAVLDVVAQVFQAGVVGEGNEARVAGVGRAGLAPHALVAEGALHRGFQHGRVGQRHGLGRELGLGQVEVEAHQIGRHGVRAHQPR